MEKRVVKEDRRKFKKLNTVQSLKKALLKFDFTREVLGELKIDNTNLSPKKVANLISTKLSTK